MMAKRLFSSFKNVNISLVHNFTYNSGHLPAICVIPTVRYLYSKTTLGLDGYLKQNEIVRRQMDNISEKFKEKMYEYVGGEKNMVFTEDLKNMIHLATTDDDINLVVSMIKKFNQQNKQMRFGNYIFGPVVMRLLHNFNRPDVALECFKSPELAGFFDQLMSYQILLDLLYENQQYDEILTLYDDIVSRQVEAARYPRNIVVLALAACYKLNSKESLDRALKIWKQLKDVGHFPMRRATTFCAGLAYNQGEPGIALEILSSAKNQNYSTVRNLKVASLAGIGRVENVIPILKTVLSDDSGRENKYTFSIEAIEACKKAFEKSDNTELKMEFERTVQLLEQGGHIDETSFDEQLCKEIQPPPSLNNRNSPNQQPRFRRDNFRPNYFQSNRYSKPGLNEMG